MPGFRKKDPIQESSNLFGVKALLEGYNDSPSVDAFQRLRTSNPLTIFDAKQLYDNLPLQFDDAQTSGSGTSSSHSTNTASTTISVGATTAGTRVRQTFRRFNYESGKSQLILMTGTFAAAASGVNQRLGYFDENNGLFFEVDGDGIHVVKRTSTSGSPVDTKVDQSDWNIDTLNGSGPDKDGGDTTNPSGITLDFTKSHVFVIDFEWLGVGRVRMGFVIDGIVCYVHEFLHANILAGVYMSTPNLPVRYEISNDGTGAASSLEHICATVISEAGTLDTGDDKWHSTGDAHVDASVLGTVYALVGIRLKSTHLDSGVLIRRLFGMSLSNVEYELILYRNPTVAGTFTYSDVANSSVQMATGATANTITGGVQIAGAFGAGSSATDSVEMSGSLWLGAQIDGTPVEYVLCARPYGNNADIHGAIQTREMI